MTVRSSSSGRQGASIGTASVLCASSSSKVHQIASNSVSASLIKSNRLGKEGIAEHWRDFRQEDARALAFAAAEIVQAYFLGRHGTGGARGTAGTSGCGGGGHRGLHFHVGHVWLAAVEVLGEEPGLVKPGQVGLPHFRVHAPPRGPTLGQRLGRNVLGALDAHAQVQIDVVFSL